MGKVAISIELPTRSFVKGDVLRGEVVVGVRAATRCNGLTLFLGWRIEGAGTGERAVGHERVLFNGGWQPGEYRYPFAVQLSHAPYSYEGHHMKIEWFVRAVADIPLALDPSEEVTFSLAPPRGPVDVEEALVPTPKEPEYEVPDWLMVSGGVALCSGAAWSVTSSLSSSIFMVLCVGGLGVAVGGAGVKNLMSRKVFEDAVLECEPHVAWPGAQVMVMLRFTPRMELMVNAVTLTLKAREEAILRGGKNSSRYEHIAHERSFDLDVAGTLPAGEQVCLERMIDLPGNAPATFHGLNHTFEWVVEARVDIPNWPDWVGKAEVLVGDQVLSSW